MKKYLFITIFISISSLASAQFFLGGTYGYRKSGFNSRLTFQSIGVRLEKKIPEAELYFNLVYETKKYNTYINGISYVKPVLGIDFNIGRRVFLIIGVGLAPKLLVQNKNYVSTPNKFVLDGIINSGIGANLGEKIRLHGSWQYHINITPFNIWNKPDHFGGSTEVPERDNNAYPQISLTYKIQSKKNQE